MTQKKILIIGAVLFAALILYLVVRPPASNQTTASAESASLQKQWEFQAGGSVKGSLALDDDTLYAASDDGFLYALDLSGTLRWKTHVGPSLSSPSVGSDGAIYISNNNGRVVALNRSGSVRWTADAYDGQTWGQNGSAIGRSYLYAPSRGTISAIRLSDGHVDWNNTLLGGEQWGSVTLLPDGTILSPGRGRLNALDSSGQVMWQVPPLTAEQTQRNGGFPPPGNGFVTSGIAVTSDRTLLTVSSARIVALGMDGTEKWGIDAPRGRATPLVAADGTIYAVSGIGTFYALDSYGNQKWKLELGETLATPVIAEDGTVFVHSLSYLYAISPDGKLLVKMENGDNVAPEASPTLASDGTLIVATTHGKISAYAGGHGGLMNSTWPKYQADLANTGVPHLP